MLKAKPGTNKNILVYKMTRSRAKNFDDGIRPGRIVAVADYRGGKKKKVGA